MLSNKTGEMMQKLIQGTLDKKYKWKKFSGIPSILFSQISPSDASIINTMNSYSFEDEETFIALVSTVEKRYYIFLYNKKRYEGTKIFIHTEAYFRLKTIIQSQEDFQESLIDDFLNS